MIEAPSIAAVVGVKISKLQEHDVVLLQAEYDVIVISPPGSASGDFSWRISERATMTSW